MRVEVRDKREHPGDREDVALIVLLDNGNNVLMTEMVTGTSGAHASKLAHERADRLRMALGLLNCYSVSDGASKLTDVYALDLVDALIKLARDQPDAFKTKHSLRIDIVTKGP